jgi:hypothetical protein
MNQVSNIINLFSDIYCVSDMEFAKIHGELLRRLITVQSHTPLLSRTSSSCGPLLLYHTILPQRRLHCYPRCRRHHANIGCHFLLFARYLLMIE